MATVYSYYQPLYNFAFKFTQNVEDAEDLLQETFIKAIRFEERFREDTNLRGWLFTIMRNTFINDYRNKSKRRDLVE